MNPNLHNLCQLIIQSSIQPFCCNFSPQHGNCGHFTRNIKIIDFRKMPFKTNILIIAN